MSFLSYTKITVVTGSLLSFGDKCWVPVLNDIKENFTTAYGKTEDGLLFSGE